MKKHLTYGLVVRDYDEAVDFYVRELGFVLAEDADMGDDRWVTITRSGNQDCTIALHRAQREDDLALVGWRDLRHESFLSMTQAGGEDTNEHAVESRALRMVTYNLGQGGRRDAGLWLRLLGAPSPDLLFVQESRDPDESWLAELGSSPPVQCLWEAASGRWGTGLCVRGGRLVPLPVPPGYRGRVVAAVVEGLAWPVVGSTAIAAISIRGPTAKGSSNIKEMARILDFIPALADGLPLVLGGDFNVAVALRTEDHPLYPSPGERMLLARLRDELGLLPCWQAVHPDHVPARTLRWMRRQDSLPYHCDGLFVPVAWTASLLTCEVLEDETWCALSDHNPVAATFALANS